MTLLRTYLVMAVLRGVATVLAVLVAVTCVIEFVGQLNDVGTGDYGLQAALTYVGSAEFRARSSRRCRSPL